MKNKKSERMAWILSCINSAEDGDLSRKAMENIGEVSEQQFGVLRHPGQHRGREQVH